MFTDIAREYGFSDRRKLFVPCPHCDHAQTLTWADVKWTRGPNDEHFPKTAGILCRACGSIWSERDRKQALAALEHAPGYGWGEQEESWWLDFEIIPGDPSQTYIWNELDPLIARQFNRRDGVQLRVAAVGIDRGGHHGSSVSAFCRKRRGRRIFPTHGFAGKQPLWDPRMRRAKTNDPYWAIGADTAKSAIYGRLKIVPNPDGSQTPGAMHFPTNFGGKFGPSFYSQLTAERCELRYRMGQKYMVWDARGKRNEALDIAVGCLAMRRSLGNAINDLILWPISPLQSR